MPESNGRCLSMSRVGLATRMALGDLWAVGRQQLSVSSAYPIQRKNRPSTVKELTEEVLSVEDEREPISIVSSWNLATRGLLENRELPTWRRVG